MTHEETPEIQEMTSWPGTPSYERLMEANRILEENSGLPIAVIRAGEKTPGEIETILRSVNDAEILLELDQVESFKQWAYEEAQETFIEDQNVIEQLAQIAMHGTCERFLGTAIAIPPQPGESRHAYTFTKILRDPEWIGLDNTWQLCRGLNIHLFSGKNWQGRPALMLILPTNWKVQETRKSAIQDSISQTVKQVAAWHGALQTLMYTYPRSP